MNIPKKDNGSKKKDELVDGQKGKDDTSYTLVSYQRKMHGTARIEDSPMPVYHAVTPGKLKEFKEFQRPYIWP
jgi:hypothetical protein